MAELPLSELVAELSAELAAAAEQGERHPLRCDAVDVALPAHVRLSRPRVVSDAGEPGRQLLVTLPSTREVPSAGRLARLQLTLRRTRAAADSLGHEEVA